jgi:hypothetical protein
MSSAPKLRHKFSRTPRVVSVWALMLVMFMRWSDQIGNPTNSQTWRGMTTISDLESRTQLIFLSVPLTLASRQCKGKL